MVRNWRHLPYGLVGAALLLAVIAAPGTWSTPSGVALAQTVPTATPTPGPVSPTTQPPAGTARPTLTPVPGATAALATPSGTSGTSGANPVCAASTLLTLVADRTAVAPGVTVVFTATLTNTSRQTLKQIVLDDQLSAGLEPVQVLLGQGTWQNRAFRIAAPTLEPGAKLVAVYSAKVAAQPGPVLTARASVTSAGCPAKTALVTLALPPTELPRTGGSLD